MNKQSENILYVRSDVSGRETKIQYQIEEAKKYAEQNSLSYNIIEDVGISGSKPLHQRAGMTKILELLEAGVVKTIIVSSFSVLSKNFAGVQYLYSLLGSQKAQLVILDQEDMEHDVSHDPEIDDLINYIKSNKQEILARTASKVNN